MRRNPWRREGSNEWSGVHAVRSTGASYEGTKKKEEGDYKAALSGDFPE